MATVTGFTSGRMLAIEAGSVVSGAVSGDNLILTKHDGSTINAGNVRGPQGVTGAGVQPTTLAAGVNLNTQTLTANYIQTTDANATLDMNYPVTIAGFLEVRGNSAQTVVLQRYTLQSTSNSPICYARNLMGGVWSPWILQGSRKYAVSSFCTTSLIMTSTDTILAGTTISVPVLSSMSQFEVTAVFDMSSIGATSTLLVGQLKVDSTFQSAQAIWGNAGINGLRGPAIQKWLVTGLSVGTHTFALYGRRSGGADSMIKANNTHTTLTITQAV